jgi:hypothetical protein
MEAAQRALAAERQAAIPGAWGAVEQVRRRAAARFQ